MIGNVVITEAAPEPPKDAQEFLDRAASAAKRGTPHGLNQLPFALMPAVAKVMEEYAGFRLKQANGAKA